MSDESKEQIEQAKKLLTDNGFVLRTKDEETQLFVNFESEKKQRYDAGYETAQKRLIVDNAKNFGVDLEGKEKNIENFAEAFKEKIIKETKVPVDKRISELESDNAKLLQNLKQFETEANNIKQKFIEKEQTEKRRSRLNKGIPANVDFILSKDEIIQFAESSVNFKFENDNIFIEKDGQILKNNITLQPITPEEYISDFSKKFVKPVTGGTGAKDEKPGTVGSYEVFREEMKKAGNNEGSEKFNIEMNSRIKAGTLKI